MLQALSSLQLSFAEFQVEHRQAAVERRQAALESRQLVASVNELKRGLESSFFSSPFGDHALSGSLPIPSERPTRASGGNRSRLPQTKMSKYAIAWDTKMKLHPENSRYQVHYSVLGQTFQLLHTQQDDESTEVRYECMGTHAYIKSAFFIFGLTRYNCDDFVAYVRVSGVPLLQQLSPDESQVSFFEGQSS